MRNEIPDHTSCVNCGECCGPVLCTSKEKAEIIDYLKTISTFERIAVMNQKRDFWTCECRDQARKKCLIYPVRPTICQLMGVTKGMSCSHGNTCEIDGRKFITGSILECESLEGIIQESLT